MYYGFMIFSQSVGDIGATSFNSYTDATEEIIRKTKERLRSEQNSTSNKYCCDYDNQILDKFCATQVSTMSA